MSGLGLSMMLKSLGIDPDEMNKAVAKVMADIHTATVEIERQGKILALIAEKLNIDLEKEFSNGQSFEQGNVNRAIAGTDQRGGN